MKRMILFALGCSSIWLAGCSGSGLMEISGRVTLDGEPLEKGTISFHPSDGQGPTAGAIITEGKYSLQVAPGPKKAEILGYKKVGQQKVTYADSTTRLEDVNEQIVPERYNTKTELEAEVRQGKNTFDFKLRTTPK